MDQDKDSLPVIDLDAARVAKTPFRLTKQARQSFIRPTNMPKNTIGLLHNALLCDGLFSLYVRDSSDQQFTISVLKEHKKIDELRRNIQLNTGIDQQFAEAIQSSQIFGISIYTSNTESEQLLPALANMNILKTLSISCSISPEEYNVFASVIQNNEHLETLCMSIDGMPGELVTALVPAISTHKSLKYVKFDRLGGHTGLQATSEILRKNNSIQKLDLLDFQSYYEVSEEDIRHLCSALEINKSLHTITFMTLSEAATVLFFESLAHNQCLTTITMSTARITENIMRALSESLKTNTRLTALNFTGCSLTEATCQLFCEGLLKSQNKSLRQLSMNTGEPGMIGAKAICELINCSKITELSLITCKINAEQCKLIARLLERNTSLVKLSLMANTLGDEGLISICEALLTNTTLRALDVSYVNCRVPGLTGVKDMLMCNVSLRRLSISVNYKDKKCVDLLCEGLKRNNSLTHLQCYCASIVDKTRLWISRRLAETLQDNFALDEVELDFDSHPFTDLLRRNRRLKSSMKFFVAILSHNIARSDHALTILPREIWQLILSSITSPGMEPFTDLVAAVFNAYE